MAAADLARGEAKGVSQQQRDSIDACWEHLGRLLDDDTPARDIDYDTIEDYARLRRGEGARGQSIRKELQALARGLKIAKRKKSIKEVPDFPEVNSDPPNPRQKGKLHPLPVLLRWFVALDKDKRAKGARDQAELVLYTGLRAEEVRRLAEAWVEAAPPGAEVAALLRVPAEAAKNRRERTLGLTAPALEIVQRRAKALKAERKKAKLAYSPTEALFRGDHHKIFATAATALEYHQPITLRDLRHTHATIAAQYTGDAAAAQAALGHADLATTQRYLSSTLARTSAAAAAVEEALSAHRSPPTGEGGADENQGINSRGEWIRTTDFLLPKQKATLQRHLSECKYCQAIVAECIDLQRAAPGSAHRSAHRVAPSATTRRKVG